MRDGPIDKCRAIRVSLVAIIAIGACALASLGARHSPSASIRVKGPKSPRRNRPSYVVMPAPFLPGARRCVRLVDLPRRTCQRNRMKNFNGFRAKRPFRVPPKRSHRSVHAPAKTGHLGRSTPPTRSTAARIPTRMSRNRHDFGAINA